MRVFEIAFKDLSQILRDIRSLLFLVGMPIVFTIFMGFAYRSGDQSAPSDSRIPLGWVNNDPDGILSSQLYDLLEHSDSLKLVQLEGGTAEEAVQEGIATGVLIVPEGFSQKASTEPLPLILVAEPGSTIGQSLFNSLQTPVSQLYSSIEIASLSTTDFTGKEAEVEWQASFESAIQAWSQVDTDALVQVEYAVKQEQEEWFGDNPYNQASPGILVQFAIMGMVTTGQILVQERKTRTLQRMMTTDLRPWQIIIGHTLGMFSLVFLQIALLVIFGQWFLGVDYFRQPLGVLIISVALGLWISTMGLLISTVAKDDSQVVLFSLISMFIFSSLGGTWFPLEVAGGAFAAFGGLLPSAWVMKGYQNILIRGLGLESIWLPAAALTLYACGFFVLAIWRYRRMRT